MIHGIAQMDASGTIGLSGKDINTGRKDEA